MDTQSQHTGPSPSLTLGIGQQPYFPLGSSQQVELSGHRECPSGHVTEVGRAINATGGRERRGVRGTQEGCLFQQGTVLPLPLTWPVSPPRRYLLGQRLGASGHDAAGVGQVADGTMGTAVHSVLAARSLQVGRGCPDLCLCPCPPPPAPAPTSQPCTSGMGQHPQEPSTMTQHVEESGHSNWLPGHWTAPTEVVSVGGIPPGPSVKGPPHQ